MYCSMQKKLESFRKNERYVTKVTTDWEFDPEVAADVIESVGFGSHTHESTVNQAEKWEQFFKDRDEKGLANKIQDEMDWGYKDGYCYSTGSLSTIEMARLMIYLYYNKCDQA